MILKMLPEQIPTIWVAIKLAVVRSCEVPEARIPEVSQRLLHALMASRMVCFVRLEEPSRMILSLLILEGIMNRYTGRKELTVIGFYSFKKLSDDDAREAHQLMCAVARDLDCERLYSTASFQRSWSISEAMGWTEASRNYAFDMKGGA